MWYDVGYTTAIMQIKLVLSAKPRSEGKTKELKKPDPVPKTGINLDFAENEDWKNA